MAVRRVLIAMLVAGAVLAGCGSSSKPSGSGTSTSTPTPTAKAPTARPQVSIVAHDFNFSLPAQIPAGYVDVTLVNRGKQDHQAQLVDLGSVTFAKFDAAAIKTDIGAVTPGAVFVGGPNDAAPGKSTTATVHLVPGTYAVVCFIPGADGKPHAAAGMIGEVRVVKTAASVETLPAASATIVLRDFSYTLPAGFTGKGTVEVSNQGAEVHELNLFALAPGVTLAQAKAALLASGPPPAGPPPITEVTGTVGLSARHDAWLHLDLTPGHYMLVCFFPDPAKGNVPHVLEGMIKEFVIS